MMIKSNKIFPIEIGNSKDKYCCICLNYKNIEECKFYKAPCKHEWCIICHQNLKKDHNKCPLCRKQFIKKETQKYNIENFNKNIFNIFIKFLFIILFLIFLLIGRGTYLILYCNNCNFFDKRFIWWFMTSFFGYILFAVFFTLSCIFIYFIKKKICL
jgi:hypothetical protein